MEIKTPRGLIIINNSTMKAELKWNPDFENKINREYSIGSPLQKFVDSEYMRSVEPYMPLKTSMMIKSMTLGTEIGSGTIRIIAPYSQHQLHEGREPGESQTGPLRGRDWHERWKADKLNSFIASVVAFARKG